MHQIDLTGKNALVTGAAGGIGRACAQTLAAAGARVAVVDVNLEGAQETVAPLDGGLALRCDLGNPADVATMRAQVLAEMGGLDILVNNAGIISYRTGIRAVTVEEWDLLLNVNLRGAFLVCREFVDAIKARRGGKIINFSSLAARIASIEAGTHYSISKAGMISLTRNLAKECAPFGVCVNAVAPGIIATGPVKKQVAGREQEYHERIPLGRMGEPQDVANVVLFLASPLADYVTGIVLDINGGLYMG